MADEETKVTENTTTETETKETEQTKEETVQETDTKVEESSEGTTQESEKVEIANTEQITTALNKKGIDYNNLADEYITNGKLSDKTLKELADVGISKELVDEHIKGYEARAEVERNELSKCVGGREAMDEIIDWAAHNLQKDEIIALNSIRNKFELESVLIGLKARMVEKEGKTPDYQRGTGDKTKSGGFRSQAEMFEAIKDPRYSKDEAYRADVTKKIQASREAGINLGIY